MFEAAVQSAIGASELGVSAALPARETIPRGDPGNALPQRAFSQEP
ncbi:hypothetical protein [Amycolatopsis sp. WGS_07]